MADNPPSSPTRRRSSFVDIFSSRPNPTPTNTAGPSSTSAAAVPAMPSTSEQPLPQRRISIADTLGLSGTGTSPTSPYSAFARQRHASIATSTASGSPEFRNSFGDESAVLEEDDTLGSGPPSAPSSFGRRLSFGAQALKDVRSGSGVGSPGGDGFNWSDALRERSKRSPSFTSGNPFGTSAMRVRSNSNAQEPPKQMPKPVEQQQPPLRMKKPDQLGERMLRGDFMMD